MHGPGQLFVRSLVIAAALSVSGCESKAEQNRALLDQKLTEARPAIEALERVNRGLPDAPPCSGPPEQPVILFDVDELKAGLGGQPQPHRKWELGAALKGQCGGYKLASDAATLQKPIDETRDLGFYMGMVGTLSSCFRDGKSIAVWYPTDIIEAKYANGSYTGGSASAEVHIFAPSGEARCRMTVQASSAPTVEVKVRNLNDPARIDEALAVDLRYELERRIREQLGIKQ